MTVEHVQVAVVGGGQAGLAVSRELAGLGAEPVVLERGRVAQTWRDRWESFCFVTPNWCTQLPGGAYDGPAPDAFMLRDEVVAYLEEYAEVSGVPVREGVDVQSIGMSDEPRRLSLPQEVDADEVDPRPCDALAVLVDGKAGRFRRARRRRGCGDRRASHRRSSRRGLSAETS